MAQGKINIYGSRITNGTWQVLADGGWVNAALLMGPRAAQAKWFVEAMPSEYWTRHKDGQNYTYDPGKVAVQDTPPPKGKPRPKDADSGGNDPADQGDEQGDGEQDNEGTGDGENGDGDDSYVLHSEFDPWQDKAEKVFKNVDNIAREMGTVVGKVGTLEDRTARLERENKRLTSEVTTLKLHGGGSGGNGGGVIVKVDVKLPNVPDWKANEGLFHNQFPKLLSSVAAGIHCYLPGPPGSGKSHAAKQVADALGWKFGSLSLGPTTPESRLWGGRDANNQFHEPSPVKGARWAMNNPDNGFVLCLDELDNGHPGIIATLNSAMANGWFEAPNGDLIEWGDNFVIVGSANTYGTGPTAEFSGRNRLDAATLDRFNYLPWDTDLEMERTMVVSILAGNDALTADWLDVWSSIRRNVEQHGLKVFVTMRGAIRGAKMLACGRDIYETTNEVLLNKIPADQRDKITPF